MRSGARRSTLGGGALFMMMVLAACSGGDAADPAGSADADTGQSAVDTGESASSDTSPVAGAGDEGGAGGVGVVIGEPTLTADPGQAWVEVDGERFEYVTAGSINLECVVADDRVVINFQTGDGHDFLVQGSPQTGDWFLNMAFAPGEDNVQYGTSSSMGNGTFVLGDGVLSYEGQVDRIVDFDLANAEAVDAEVAVNCASPGGDPTATVGGTDYVFPLSGAQSVTCEVGTDRVDVLINRLAIDGLQLEVSARNEGGQWIGAVTVFTGDGNYGSTIPADGSGLLIDGTSVAYDGTFVSPTGTELDGTVEVSC